MKDEKGKELEFADTFLTRNSVISANEYTGLVTSAIESEEEAEAYSGDFKIHEQKESKMDD